MHSTGRLASTLWAATSLAFVVLAVLHWRLSARVAALEVVAAQRIVDEATPSSSTVHALQDAVSAWREAQSAGEGAMTQDEAAEVVQVALDRALETSLDDVLDRRADAREQQRNERIVASTEAGLQAELDELARDFELTEEQTTEATAVVTTALQTGLDLRGAVRRGDVSPFDALAEGRALREEVSTSLTDVLGEEAYEELGRRLNGEEGWSAARGPFGR